MPQHGSQLWPDTLGCHCCRGNAAAFAAFIFQQNSSADVEADDKRRIERTSGRDILQFYDIREELGAGTYATVRRAVHKETGEEVAVKIIDKKRCVACRGVGGARAWHSCLSWIVCTSLRLHGNRLRSSCSRAKTRGSRQDISRTPPPRSSSTHRFRLLPSFDLSGLLREAEVLQKLSHPSIIALRDLFQTDDTLYIVTEYVTGGELFDRLVDIGPYAEADAKKLTWRLFEAIKYMHDRNIVHRGGSLPWSERGRIINRPPSPGGCVCVRGAHPHVEDGVAHRVPLCDARARPEAGEHPDPEQGGRHTDQGGGLRRRQVPGLRRPEDVLRLATVLR